MRRRALLALLPALVSVMLAQAAAADAGAPQSFRIAGMVVNSLTNQPIASASVAIAPVEQGSERDIARSVLTGSDGHFSFDGLPRGKYSLMAQARGFTLQAFEHHDIYASAIVAGPGLDSESLIFRLDPDASLEGHVTDDNNEPVQSAMVRMFRKMIQDGRQKVVPMDQGQTDDQGNYRLGHVSPGTYFIVFSARPWYAQNTRDVMQRRRASADDNSESSRDATLDVTYPLTFYPDAFDSASASPVVVHPGDHLTADAVMHAMPAAHLRIRTGGAGNANPGFENIYPRISQRLFDGYLDPAFNAPVSWPEPGVIEIAGLAPGRYVVEMPSVNTAGHKESRGWYQDVDLTGDTEITVADSPAFASVDGLMWFDGAARVPQGSEIGLINRDTQEMFNSAISERGEFSFHSDQVRPGHYLVVLSTSGGYLLTKLAATGAKISGQSLQITAADKVRISAMASRAVAHVTGTAMRDGKPFAGAMIVLVPDDPEGNLPLFRRDQSDSDGTFSLPNVVPGHYVLLAINDGWDLQWSDPVVLAPYRKAGTPVQITGDGEVEEQVQVQPAMQP
jgi:hypothetical protein